MTQFNVRQAVTHGPVPYFKAVGYPTAGTSVVIESGLTLDRAEAEEWAAAASRGEWPAATKWASYNDD